MYLESFRIARRDESTLLGGEFRASSFDIVINSTSVPCPVISLVHLVHLP